MFDDQFKPYLIEVNSGPLLDNSPPLLSRLVPSMLENTFRIAIDPLFPPPKGVREMTCLNLLVPSTDITKECSPLNKYELIFDENFDDEV
jgi:hypothetical protein